MLDAYYEVLSIAQSSQSFKPSISLPLNHQITIDPVPHTSPKKNDGWYTNTLNMKNIRLDSHHHRPRSHDKHPVLRIYHILQTSGQRQTLGATLKAVLYLIRYCDSEITLSQSSVDEGNAKSVSMKCK